MSYNFNRSYFDDILTERQAYWLGFITADGCLSRKGDLIIQLQSQDCDHLKQFITDIEGNNRIQHISGVSNFGPFRACRIAMRSQQIASALKRHGITPAKSLFVEAARLAANLQRHYWRGVFDGDGHCSFYMNGKNPVFEIGLSGNRFITRSFLDFVRQETGIEASLRTDKTNWRCSFVNGQAQIVSRLLYDDSSVSLARKSTSVQRGFAMVFRKRVKRNYTRKFLTELYKDKGTWIAVANSLGIHKSNFTKIRNAAV